MAARRASNGSASKFVPRLSLSERRKLVLRPVDASTVVEAQHRKHSKLGLANFQDAYELGAVLGSGSMTVVRLARKRADGGEVAVKCISCPELELQQCTREEYRLMLELRHPAILQVFALYESGQGMWICMEFCRDGCLESYVERNGVFDELRGRHLFLQLLQAVNYMHRKRVVHRDLKPANLLLCGGASQLRVADFNSAKRIGSSAGSSLMLTDRGTHLYSAPELRFGRLWNERVDIWACGLCLFFLLRACLPFNPEGPGIAKTLLSGELPDIRWDGMGDLVKNLIQQCLTVRMQDRPPAMELLMHPLFNRDSPMERTGRLRFRLTDSVDMAAEAEDDGLAGDVVEEPSELFVLLPACGLLCVSQPNSAPRARAAPPPTPGSPWFPNGCNFMTATLSTSSEDTPRGSHRLRAAMLESPRLPRKRECYWTMGGGNSTFSMLRQLARTKCERAMERDGAQDAASGADMADAPLSPTLRRNWTSDGKFGVAESEDPALP